jgi:hypothetical protein
MPTALVAALLGAVVAFGGTYLLQRAQFRRAELEAVQDRIGIARALRADLYVAKLSTQNSLKTQVIPPGMQYPTDLWIAQGHGIMKAIEPAAQDALMQAFGRMGAVNGLLAVLGSAGLAVSHDPASGVTLDGLVELIDTAVATLNGLEDFWVRRERRLRHPIKDRWPSVG